jgi:hypothetical protein
VYEPITVEVDRGYGEGNYRSYSINFIGRLIQYLGLTRNSPPRSFWDLPGTRANEVRIIPERDSDFEYPPSAPIKHRGFLPPLIS